jgi:DNA adenine methylase
MRYMGSKARYAAQIMPILMRGHNGNRWYIEPFVGGGNMISACPADNRWGNDVAAFAVALLEAVARGWVPPDDIDLRTYNDIRQNPMRHDPALVGFAMYCCSYAGKPWGGYWRATDKNGFARSGAAEQQRHLLKQASSIRGIKWTTAHFSDIEIPNGATVYCDPPYAGTTGYGGHFDHDAFWSWAADLATRCRVFVSEYTAPDGLCDLVWEKNVANSLTKDTGAKRGVEKLFRVRP